MAYIPIKKLEQENAIPSAATFNAVVQVLKYITGNGVLVSINRNGGLHLELDWSQLETMIQSRIDAADIDGMDVSYITINGKKVAKLKTPDYDTDDTEADACSAPGSLLNSPEIIPGYATDGTYVRAIQNGCEVYIKVGECE